MKTDISSINEDFKFQKTGWPVQKIFWISVLLVLIYGMFGGFGEPGGLLNRKSVTIGGTVVEYDKYLRVEMSFITKILLPGDQKDFSVAFNEDYVDHVRITQVIPEPDRVIIADNQLIYHFNSVKAGTITFFKDPVSMGRQSLSVTVNGESKELSQFIFF